MKAMATGSLRISRMQPNADGKEIRILRIALLSIAKLAASGLTLAQEDLKIQG